MSCLTGLMTVSRNRLAEKPAFQDGHLIRAENREMRGKKKWLHIMQIGCIIDESFTEEKRKRRE